MKFLISTGSGKKDKKIRQRLLLKDKDAEVVILETIIQGQSSRLSKNSFRQDIKGICARTHSDVVYIGDNLSVIPEYENFFLMDGGASNRSYALDRKGGYWNCSLGDVLTYTNAKPTTELKCEMISICSIKDGYEGKWPDVSIEDFTRFRLNELRRQRKISVSAQQFFLEEALNNIKAGSRLAVGNSGGRQVYYEHDHKGRFARDYAFIAGVECVVTRTSKRGDLITINYINLSDVSMEKVIKHYLNQGNCFTYYDNPGKEFSDIFTHKLIPIPKNSSVCVTVHKSLLGVVDTELCL